MLYLQLNTMFDRNQPYNTLAKLPPPKEQLETPRILKKLITAHKELAALKGEARGLPNQKILFTTLPLQEAASSCKIENIVTTQDKVYEALSFPEKESSIAIKEVLNYRESIRAALKFLDQNEKLMTTRLFEKTCSILRSTNIKVRTGSDTTLKNSKGETVYTPPMGEKKIRDLLQNLEELLNDSNNDIDDLVKMSIAHYQFEAIHPFSDGNGRTGRILNIVFLIRQKLLDHPILYLSHHINKTKENYYKGLREVTTKGLWENWILYMLDVIEQSAYKTRKKVEEMKDLFEKQYQVIQETKLNNAKDLLELIFMNPYLRINHFTAQKLGTRLTATRHLNLLVSKNILIKQKIGNHLIYINKDLWKLISQIN